MNIDSAKLQAFITLADTKSFSRTAEKLGRTQSAISQQILKLEELAGKALIARTKPFQLTPDGKLLLLYARKIYQLHCELYDQLHKPELAGELRVGIPEDFAAVFLQEALSDFIKIHPRVVVNVECDLTFPLFEKFQQGKLDIVLLKMDVPTHYPYGVELWSEELVWVGDSFYNNFQETLPLVLSPEPCVYRSEAIHALQAAGRSWRIMFSSHSFAGKIAAVSAGLGVTVLPKNMLPPHLSILSSADTLPALKNTHLSLLYKTPKSETMESFLAQILSALRKS